MRSPDDIQIKKLLDEEYRALYNNQREDLREDAKKSILKIQEENRRSYNLRRKPAKKYKLHDLVAVKRTQLGGGLKLKSKYLGPYEITKCKFNNTYDVVKVGFSEGPKRTTTCAEFIKPWSEFSSTSDTDDETAFEPNA